MSGAEIGIIAVIAANAGTIMPILISVIAIIGSIVGFIRYLKKNVTKEVVELRKDVGEKFDSINEKLVNNQAIMVDDKQRIIDRMTEIKQMIEILDRRLTEIRVDVDKRLDFKRAEIDRIQEQLNKLREELQRLEIEQARRMGASDSRMDEQDYRMDRGGSKRRSGPPIR
jgi:SMC interacting uncharacterized protein involved in chromosome segregation